MSFNYFVNLIETDEDKFRDEFITTNFSNTENEYLFDLYLYKILEQDNNILNDIDYITNIYLFIDLIHESNKLQESYIVKNTKNIIIKDTEYLKNIKMIYFIFKYMDKSGINIPKKLITDIVESKYRFDENSSEQFEFEYINLLKHIFNNVVELSQYTLDTLHNTFYNIFMYEMTASKYYIISDKFSIQFRIEKLEKMYFDEDNLTLREKLLDMLLFDIQKITYSNWSKISTMLNKIYTEGEITEKHKIKIINTINYNNIIDLQTYSNTQDPNFIILLNLVVHSLYDNEVIIDDYVYEKLLSTNIILNEILRNIGDIYDYIEQRLLYVSKDVSQIYTFIDNILYNNEEGQIYKIKDNIDKYYQFFITYVDKYLKLNDLYDYDVIGLIYDTYIVSEYDHLGLDFLERYYDIIDIQDTLYNPTIAEKIFIILLDKVPEKVIDLLNVTPIYAHVFAKITMSDVDYHPLIDKYLNLLVEQIKKDKDHIETRIKNIEIRPYYQINILIPTDYSYLYVYIKKYGIEKQIYYYLSRLLLSKPLTDITMDLLISYLIQAGDYLDAKMYRTRLIQEHYMKKSITNTPNFMINNDTETIMNLLGYIKK